MTSADDPTQEREPLQSEAWKWVLHMTSGDATKADIAALERWCAENSLHAEAYARASGTWRAFGPAMENVARQDATLSASQGAGMQRFAGRRAFLGGVLAASAAGVTFMTVRPPLGLWPSLTELAADYRTATGEQRRIALADHVSVEMNTKTSLNIRRVTEAADHVELISGEVAVATQSGSIEVTAAHGRAWADSAQFNMRLDGSGVCVTCLDGIVHVEQQGRSVTLQQKQQVAYTERSLGQMAAIDPTEVVGWREGDLLFRDEPLSQVIEEINRYRPGKIVLVNEDLGRRRVTARFRLDRLEVVFIQLRETFSARVTPLPGGIVLVS
jgi:transmembrane sensor